jgi:hypothetical protein
MLQSYRPHLKKFCPEMRVVNSAKRVNVCHSSSLNQQQTVELPASGRLLESDAVSAAVPRRPACRPINRDNISPHSQVRVAFRKQLKLKVMKPRYSLLSRFVSRRLMIW